MTEQWQELKETITEMRDNDGTLTQQEVCKFLANHMDILEKQMQQLTDAKETIIKSALKGLVKMQIEEGSVGVAVDNDHDHDCCWDDVLAWLEAQPMDAEREAYIKGYDYGVKDWFKSKTQPCENCVSRDSLNDAISKLTYWHFEDGRLVVGGGGIKSETVYKVDDVVRIPDILPPVKPKYTDEEIDKAQAVEQAYVDKMVELAVEGIKKRYFDAIGKMRKVIDEMTEIHSDGEFYIKSVDAKWIISKYLCGAEMSGGGKDG
jgi:hypothetical protein